MTRRSAVAIVCSALLLGLVAALSAQTPEVAVVRSDWQGLTQPVPADRVLDQAQTESIVRAALAELGGIGRFVRPEHRWVVIKPNIVEASERGSGDITDSYVVWALARLVHEAAPAARITVADGPGSWVPPGHEQEAELFRVACVDGSMRGGTR